MRRSWEMWLLIDSTVKYRAEVNLMWRDAKERRDRSMLDVDWPERTDRLALMAVREFGGGSLAL